MHLSTVREPKAVRGESEWEGGGDVILRDSGLTSAAFLIFLVLFSFLDESLHLLSTQMVV